MKKGTCPSCEGKGKYTNFLGKKVKCMMCGGSGVFVSPFKLIRR
jgi:DnaJ-class molecular chaperone